MNLTTPDRDTGSRGTVVVISSVHWHFNWQRHHDISSRLAARGYEVIFLEPLPKRWPGWSQARRILGRLSGRSTISGGGRQQEVTGVELVSPLLLPDVGRSSRAINRALFVPLLARRLKTRIESRPLIVLDYLPISSSVALLRSLEPDLAVYDCVWDWSSDPHAAAETIREEALLAEVDLVMTDSPYLFDKMKSVHSRVRRILPAVDLSVFGPLDSSGPAEVGSPFCGYFGQIGANIDFDLMRSLSHKFRLRLIGPVEGSLEGLGSRSEVLGSVPREHLPGLLRDIDVLVLPYKKEGHTRGVIPAKTFECLATGKPTVAIGLPSLTEYDELFHLCETEEEFLEAVSRAAADQPELRERRVRMARENSWEQRIEEVEQVLLEGLAEKGWNQGARNGPPSKGIVASARGGVQ
jgi:glycosyltransferase involved in cell wall biosynthesis